jgi:hypothetical protein
LHYLKTKLNGQAVEEIVFRLNRTYEEPNRTSVGLNIKGFVITRQE